MFLVSRCWSHWEKKRSFCIRNAVFIPRYGASGAAFGTLVAEAVVLAVQAAALKNMAWEIIKKVEVWKILPAAALSGAAMVFIKNKLNMPVFPVLVICFSVFFSIYGILLLGMKERILMELLRTAAKRLKQKEREE